MINKLQNNRMSAMNNNFVKIRCSILLYTLIFLLSLSSQTSLAQIEVILRKTFIDSLKNKVTISSNFMVVHSHEKPNPPSKDRDMHIAGIASTVGLPVVAEIMNAKFETGAVNLIHTKEGTSNPILLNGVWRIWCEHAGTEDKQDQGEGFPPIMNTNPDHVFEIHPATKIENFDLIKSLKPITGYKYKETNDAFFKYSNARCKLTDLGNKIKLATNGVGYNYVEFWIEITNTDPFVVDDGRFVFCRVLDKEGEIVSQKSRMVFPKDSEAEKKVQTMKIGDVLHVIGIPRIDLALVSYRIENASKSPEMLEWNLPVEMIIVAKFRK
jgi:hypothetical protein